MAEEKKTEYLGDFGGTPDEPNHGRAAALARDDSPVVTPTADATPVATPKGMK